MRVASPCGEVSSTCASCASCAGVASTLSGNTHSDLTGVDTASAIAVAVDDAAAVRRHSSSRE